MGTQVLMGEPAQAPASTDNGHRRRWRLAALAAALLIALVLVYGYEYYTAPLIEKARHPLHQLLRPSGTIGMKLGMLGGMLFCLIYLYPIRKRWAWLRSIGRTKNWLDFHILMGIVAPLLISLHSSFRFEGIAGMAFWIMWTVVASGVVGKYLYAQIPRRLSAAEMTLDEIAFVQSEVSGGLGGQTRVSAEELERLFAVPDPVVIRDMSSGKALSLMLWIDLSRPLQIAGLRRRSLGFRKRVVSLWGLLPARDCEFESVIDLVRRRAWLSTKVVFLDKVQRVFHLWHVIHRPFSYSFAVLVILHISFVILLGYF